MSNEARHTPEPWIVDESGPMSIWHHAGGLFIGETWDRRMASNAPPTNEAIANARRIVACVNYCQGISTKELRGEPLWRLRQECHPSTQHKASARIAALGRVAEAAKETLKLPFIVAHANSDSYHNLKDHRILGSLRAALDNLGDT